MSGDAANRVLLFAGPRTIVLRTEAPAPVGPQDVRIQTLYSGISRGREMRLSRGTSPYLEKAYDAELKLFRASAEPTWKSPLPFGYENVGRIIETGSQVEYYNVGDVVYTPMPH